MAPVVDKGKKTDFEATGTSLIKSNLPVTNSAKDKSVSKKEESKNDAKADDEENAEDEVD